MSTIRKQSILSSLVVYLGFALGFLNTYLFTREGSFSPEQYGLTQAFVAIANILSSLATLGMPAYVAKFFPYYNDHLPKRQNEMLTVALLVATIGYGVVMIMGIVVKDAVLARFSNAPLLQQYYYWIFPFGYGLTLYSILEVYGWNLQKAILTNFLKEFIFRLCTTILIIISTAGLLYSFANFIKIYSFFYLLIAIVLLLLLLFSKQVSFTLSISRITQKFRKKILTLCAFVWSGSLIFNVANVFDTIVLSAVLPNGLAVAGVFSLAQNISSLIQAPQRAMVSATIGPLAKAWKEKDLERIQRVYQRSSINMLLFSTAMFSLIWLNFEDGVLTFHLKQEYLSAKMAFLFIGLTRVIDMGTGVNAQIISTSTFWRFEFLSGVILLALALPLNYFLTKSLGVTGPAISNLISLGVYNSVRCGYLYKKYRMHPFSPQTIYTLLLAAACYLLAYLLFNEKQGLIWIVIRSTLFSVLFGTGVVLLNLSPDLKPVLETIRKRLGLKSTSN